MKTLSTILFALLLVVAGTSRAQSADHFEVKKNKVVHFEDWFLNKTMRFDFYHTGQADKEMFALDKVLNDGEWAGSQTVLLDELALGPYFFQVVDKATRTLIYSRGFASIFGEWQTTPEAGSSWGTFHESLRFPWPQKPVTLIISKRDANNKFQAIWSKDVDPAYRQVIQNAAKHSEKVDVIVENGPAHEKVDIVILGDGYTAGEMDKFRADANRLSEALLTNEPFASNKAKINIRAVETPALQSGVTKPHHGVYKPSPLSVQYSTFDSERYALTFDNKTVRDAASAVPYDFMVIMLNEETYGGGGIYNLYTTVSAHNAFSEYIMVHEFGHHFAALADEYYTSSVAYEVPEITVEPWETNITALFDPENLKWKDLVDDDTPVPTPWNKKAFDDFGYKNQMKRDSLRAIHSPESVMNEFFQHQLKVEDTIFAKDKYKNKVGAFEGGGYCAKGLYRPQLDCIMFTRHMTFCKVCQHSIEQVIEQYAK